MNVLNPHLLEEMKEVAMLRGRVMAGFAYIENHISSMIINHYLIKVSDREELVKIIKQDVFENEHFSFWLKFNLFKNVIDKYYPQEKKPFPFDELHQMTKIRNIMAHGAQVIEAVRKHEGESVAKGEIAIYHNGENYIAKTKVEEYFKLQSVVQTKLEDIMERLKLHTKEFEFRKDYVSRG